MLKQAAQLNIGNGALQPPSGGCVLKLRGLVYRVQPIVQPPSGGCVLKHALVEIEIAEGVQPPSGGCVLKPSLSIRHHQFD